LIISNITKPTKRLRSARAYFGVSISTSKGISIDFVNAKYRGLLRKIVQKCLGLLRGICLSCNKKPSLEEEGGLNLIQLN
jgi:hypothetical protein